MQLSLECKEGSASGALGKTTRVVLVRLSGILVARADVARCVTSAAGKQGLRQTVPERMPMPVLSCGDGGCAALLHKRPLLKTSVAWRG